MTTCPYCDDIRIAKIVEWPLHPWHIDCSCGYAWTNSSFCKTKREAKANWERYMQERNRNQMKEPKR